MEEIGADFIASGEVVGQRPMSQMKNTLNHIINETKLNGRLLRPLSAKILKPTIVEENGIVNRDLLYDINGRSRKRQMELAAKFNIPEYSSPAGGCLFTDTGISRRVKDLFDYHKNYSPMDVYWLTIGRNFRIRKEVKIIVSRNEKENTMLEKSMKDADYFFMPRFRGPNVLVKGVLTRDDINLTTSIIARYGKPDVDDNEIFMYENGFMKEKLYCSDSISDDILNTMRI